MCLKDDSMFKVNNNDDVLLAFKQRIKTYDKKCTKNRRWHERHYPV